MQVRSFIIRCAAIFLLLVFSQKSGAGLLLHNALHTESSITCSCIDDFLMPFTEADQPAIALIPEKHQLPVAFFADDIHFHTSVFTSLRGPPSDML